MGLGKTSANALGEFVELLRAAPPRTTPGVTVPLEPDLLAVLGRLVPCDVVVYNDHAIDRRTCWAASVSLGDYLTQDDFVDGDEDLFFDLYWGSYCSHPERTGDFESVVVGTDFCSLREDRASPMHKRLDEVGAAFDREMMVPLTSPPGHSRRVRFARARGREFSDNERALATLVRPHLVARMRALDLASREVAPLTDRQRQLLTLVADGYSNQQAARTLAISALTVRSHLEQIYARLGVHSRTEAVALMGSPRP